MLRRKIAGALLISAFLLPTFAFGQPSPKIYKAPDDVIDRMKEEGTKRSQVMNTISYLTDVIGGRLTNSPGMKLANEWTRDTMTKWGLQNGRLEAWGPFGRGWSLKSFSAELLGSPGRITAYPKAWSPSTAGPINSEVVYFDARSEAELDKFRGKLRRKIVFLSNVRETKADFTGLGTRRSDADLDKMTDWKPGQQPEGPRQTPPTDEERRRARDNMRFNMFTRWNFLLKEGAAIVVDNSPKGSGGTLFVQGASAVSPEPKDLDNFSFRDLLRVYDKKNQTKIIPQVVMATEDYNRIMRLIQLGKAPRMTMNIQSQYHDQDLMGYNTVAEIPGTDPALKDEVVMVGAHLDSWHSAGGATDNASGSAVAMEAARIIQALGLKPRRTIRVALWSGEEQGLNGSREYVKQHFGEVKAGTGTGGPNPVPAEIIKSGSGEYDKLSAYYNLDNGTGRIRGVYMQGNSAVERIFKEWLEPFHGMGAKTLTLQNTGGTDHLSFDRIGLPGFQFIQDEIEYSTRTHHSNMDNFDRIQAEDMKQASIIMAAFVYQTAMMDEKLPRKPVR